MRTLLLTLALTLHAAATACAGFEVGSGASKVGPGDTVKLERLPSNSNGGPFLATLSDPSPGGVIGSFTTFCVELDHYFTPGATYTITGISDETRAGGRELKQEVAWIYTQFLANNVSADVAQYGIWLNMGFNVAVVDAAFSSSSIGNVKLDYGTFFAGYMPNLNWKSAYGVQILQIGNNQSQLIPVNPTPDVTAATPEPTTLAIWGGLASLGLAVRAYRRQA